MKSKMTKEYRSNIDWMVTIVPFVVILVLGVFFFVVPEIANDILSQVRFFFGDTFGLYYLVIGVGVLLVSLFLSFSKYQFIDIIS